MYKSLFKNDVDMLSKSARSLQKYICMFVFGPRNYINMHIEYNDEFN